MIIKEVTKDEAVQLLLALRTGLTFIGNEAAINSPYIGGGSEDFDETWGLYKKDCIQ